MAENRASTISFSSHKILLSQFNSLSRAYAWILLWNWHPFLSIHTRHVAMSMAAIGPQRAKERDTRVGLGARADILPDAGGADDANQSV